jgi:hypothetical protein
MKIILFFTFILPGRSIKNTFLFTLTAWFKPHWVRTEGRSVLTHLIQLRAWWLDDCVGLEQKPAHPLWALRNRIKAYTQVT